MLAFAINEERVVCRIEVGVLARLDEVLDRFVVKARHAMTSAADDLYPVARHHRQFVLDRRPSPLPVDGVQDLCLNEHVQYVIHRTYRNAFCRTGFGELVGGEGLG